VDQPQGQSTNQPTPRVEVSRREILRAGSLATALGGTFWLTGHQPRAEAAETRGTERPLTVREGTNIAATPSPDGRWIAMDLYTSIWVLPADGGQARRLTHPFQDATKPHFSPDSRSLVFQSYRDGNYHLWSADREGTGLRQLTTGRHDHREPRWSPDGTRVAFASDRGGSYGIWIHDVATGEIKPVTDSDGEEAEPAWSPDGGRIAFTVDGVAVDEISLDTGQRRRLIHPAEHTTVFAPSYGRDGHTVAYTRVRGAVSELVVGDRPVTTGEDVFITGAHWLGAAQLLYTADGKIRRRDLTTGRVTDIPFTARVPYRLRDDRSPIRDHDTTAPQQVRGIASPVLSPDGTQVAFRALGAIWILPIGGRPHAITERDGFFHSDPDWFPDGRALVYSSDRDGDPALWRYDLNTREHQRLTDLPGAQVTPRCSPDGNQIAYQDQDGATWVFDLRSASTRRVVSALFQPGRPSWSADGRMLTLAAVKPFSKRFREGTSQILTVDLTDGQIHYTEPWPFASLSTRGDDGPVWSPDGRQMAFVVNSLLYVVDVDERGRFQTQPRKVTDEVTDAPSWSGDSRTLLYLNNGRLRRIPVTGGTPRTVDVPLTWARSRPRGRTVLRAGAVWDGESRSLRHNVAIVIENNRILSVDDDRDGDHGSDPVIDARGLTVIPGLIDAHVHWHLRGRYWGARQGRLWLAYGITTVRSPGDPAYQMLETREALDSGTIVGPRYFATGEAIDGTRVYYNFMRPTPDADALNRELSRTVGLHYDLVKTYVRLPVELQQRAVEWAHNHGVPLSSHYLYPAVWFGMDGMEHTGATNRLGYSHTVSKLGRSYGDVTEMFARSGMSITPTLFPSMVLYRDDKSLVDDPRTRALYPAWEYEQLQAKAASAGAQTPDVEQLREALKANVAMLLRIHRSGGLVIAGTDAPLDNVAISLHQNMRAMVKHGFTPHEALVIATANPARWLGLGDQLGAIRPGYLADLALVEGDPLQDIRAAAAVRMVVANGVVHRVEDLVASSGNRDTALVTAPAPTKPAATALMTALAASTANSDHWWHDEPEWSLHLCCQS
jgi:Tol biopolymer transport system component/imidazolonepropionase-like amidohydrolase